MHVFWNLIWVLRDIETPAPLDSRRIPDYSIRIYDHIFL
jgi:hypothetical protein